MGRPIKGGGNDERRVRINEVELRQWFNSGKTTAEIAGIIGCSTSPVGKALRLIGLRRQAAPRPGIGAGAKNPAWREEDALEEGLERWDSSSMVGFARDGFKSLWSKINGAESWDANPWVWVVGFKRIEG